MLLIPVPRDAPEVWSRLIAGGGGQQRQLGSWRLFAELKGHGACCQWKRVVLATPVAWRTREQQVLPGPGEPPVLAERPVVFCEGLVENPLNVRFLRCRRLTLNRSP